MKKFVSFFLVLILSLVIMMPPMASAISADSLNTTVNKIYEIPKAKRDSLFLIAAPLLITDNGVDSLINMINSYSNGTSSGMFDDYIEMALNYTDEDTLIRSLKSIKCIKPSIRQEYTDIFDRNVEYEMTQSEKSTFSSFMNKIYAQVDNLEALLADFEVTEPTLYNLMGAFGAINDQPVLKYSGGKYVFNEANTDLQNDLNEIWRDTDRAPDLTESFTEFAANLNALTTESERKKLNPLFEEIGLLAEVKESGDGGGDSSVSGGDAEFTPTATALIKELDSLSGIETTGKIYSVNISSGTGRISFSAGENDILKIVKGGEKIPVKLSANKAGTITAILSGDENYVVEPANAIPFTDVSGWSAPYISALFAREIINGKSENEFMPNASITREEFVKLICEMFDLTAAKKEKEFADVSKNAWYAKYIMAAYENGIISGISETEFGVGKNIKRQDMAKIINSVLVKYGIYGKAQEKGINDFGAISDYAKDSVAMIKGFGIISGDENGNFNPNNFATRAEAAKMVYGLIETYIANSKVNVIK